MSTVEIAQPTYQLFNNRCDICTSYSVKDKCNKCLNKRYFNHKKLGIMLFFGIITVFISLFAFKTSGLSSAGYFTASVSVSGAIYDYFFK